MALRQQFQERIHQPKEPLGVFMADLRHLAHRSYPTFSESVRDALVLDAFVRGLTPDRLRQQVRIAQPSNFDEALDQAQVIEGILEERLNGTRELMVCWRCGKTGAGVEGGALGPSAISEPPCGSSVALVSPVECCRIEAKVDGQLVRALLDTGSTVTIIHPKFLTRRVLQTARFPLVTVMGEKATLMGRCEVEICVEGHSTVMCQELRTPSSLLMGQPPDAPKAPPGLEYAHQLQDRLQSAHEFARRQALRAGIRQKRAYDHHCTGRDFNDGELVWVYSPKRKKGRSPKLDCAWVRPCYVVERLGESVYRIRKRPGGQAVVLHRNRMAPYLGERQPFKSRGQWQTAGVTHPADGGAGDAASEKGWGTSAGCEEGDPLTQAPGGTLDTLGGAGDAAPGGSGVLLGRSGLGAPEDCTMSLDHRSKGSRHRNGGHRITPEMEYRPTTPLRHGLPATGSQQTPRSRIGSQLRPREALRVPRHFMDFTFLGDEEI
ncbi:unnamed protein product [Leuciscus chuanchicus]